MEQVLVPKASSQLPRKLLRGFVIILTLLLLTGGSFYGGYYLGKMKANELQVIAEKYPLVNLDDRSGGFLRDRDRMVLYGSLESMSDDRQKITIRVYARQFHILLTPKTTLIEGSKPLSSAQRGDLVGVNMLYSTPFVADKIYFSGYRE